MIHAFASRMLPRAMFSRPLLTYAVGADPQEGLALCRMLAPDATAVRVALRLPQAAQMRLADAALRRIEDELATGESALEALRRELAAQGLEVQGEVIPGVEPAALDAIVAEQGPDVVVFGGFGAEPEVLVGWALATTRSLGVATVVGRPSAERITSLLCPFDGRSDTLATIGPLLRDRCDARHTVILLALGTLDPRLAVERGVLQGVTGVRAQVQVAAFAGSRLLVPGALEAELAAHRADLVVVAEEFAGGLASGLTMRLLLRALPGAAAPILFVPSALAPHPDHDGALDVLDALAGGDVAIRLERVRTIGGPSPLPDQQIDLVAGGVRVATLDARGGFLRVPAQFAGTFGVGRAAPGRDALGGIEATMTIVRAPAGRVALVDARLDVAALVRVREQLMGRERTLFAVRLAADEPAQAIRARWTLAGLPRPPLLDVRDLLDEGGAADVPAEVAAVRLCRAATRLRMRGMAVDAVVAHEPAWAAARGFALLGPDTLAGADERASAAFVAPPARGLATQLDLLTGSSCVEGNLLELDLDNAVARRRLLSLIDGARERLHAQWYIVEDDERSREVEQALVQAAARGVAVRVLVDSLYSRHSSFGVQNPLLARLAGVSGIEVRGSNRIEHFPSLRELKQRDHRKLATADGARGIVSGRNLARCYYQGFEEVRLEPSSSWADVPWFDASAWLEGPAVAGLDAAFLAAWTRAGGAPFVVAAAARRGDTSVRVVVHEGLVDAHTLEAYRTLIEAARERIVVVNNFPLHLELQHALLAALARGVHVSLLIGNVRPIHGEDVPFAGGSYRALGDALVRARLDVLVAAGADVRELTLAPRPHWDPALGVVRPHVHAKLLCADRRLVAIGSANLDVTAGYWESEALVVVDDPAVGAALDEQLAALLAAATPIDPRAPGWQDGAERRAWLLRVWPNVLG